MIQKKGLRNVNKQIVYCKIEIYGSIPGTTDRAGTLCVTAFVGKILEDNFDAKKLAINKNEVESQLESHLNIIDIYNAFYYYL